MSRQFTLFERGNIAILKELGYEVHCAANYSDATEALDELGIIRHHIDIQRSPFSPKQIKAFYQLKSLMKEKEFDLVHCHAPMGGLLGRVCAKITNTSPVLYTAHGFHFYKGAPLLNNLIYKTIERIMARFTDGLITINEEDFKAANKFKVRKNGKVYKVNGIGIDTNSIKKINVDKFEKKKELGIKNNEYVVLSIGEFIKRKNYETAIRAFAEANIKNTVFLICGCGELEANLRLLVQELNIEGKVIFAGYRKDIKEIVKISDVFLFTSYQEGLPVSIMEAMSAGNPIIASDIRGNTDLVSNEVNGYLVDPNNKIGFKDAIINLLKNDDLRQKMGHENLKKIIDFDISNIKNTMKKIYTEF